MEYEDRLTISTPEGLDLSLSLAGIGSRCGAALVDGTVQTMLAVAAGFLAGLASDLGAGGWIAVALFIVLIFVLVFGYDVAWEVWGGGRTPGKRLLHLRVVLASGAPIGFRASAVRNVLRIVDVLPGGYGVGLVSILVTSRNQRIGDLAAGSVVVHEPARRPAGVEMAAPADHAAWDVSAVSADDLAVVRSFLERRDSLSPQARARLAGDIARRLRAKVAAGAPGSDEEFLAAVASIKASRR